MGPALSDEEVVARIREGQLDLFDELMRRHGPRLLRAVTRQLLQRMARALEKMPEALRDVFELRSLDGLSVAETAHLLGLTVETVRVRAHRANERLRAALQGHEVDHGVAVGGGGDDD